MMGKLAALANEMAMEKRYGTKYTYAYDELDAMSKSRACYWYQRESGDVYERNWPKHFEGRRFHIDGSMTHD